MTEDTGHLFTVLILVPVSSVPRGHGGAATNQGAASPIVGQTLTGPWESAADVVRTELHVRGRQHRKQTWSLRADASRFIVPPAVSRPRGMWNVLGEHPKRR